VKPKKRSRNGGAVRNLPGGDAREQRIVGVAFTSAGAFDQVGAKVSFGRLGSRFFGFISKSGERGGICLTNLEETRESVGRSSST
jgi:hypothetical protein